MKPVNIYLYLILAIGTAVCFWQVRNFDFVNYDDDYYVYENPHVLNGLTSDGIIRAFTTPRFGNWLPLTWLSFMLDCQLFGTNPGAMHLVNLLLHIINTLLLFAVLKKMTGSLWPSAFVAAAFAIHPMHVESVAWITERKDVLSTLFLLLTLAAYASYVKQRNIVWYLLTILLFILGLLAKPMLVTLPFVLLLLDYWPLNRFEPQAAKPSDRKAPSAPLPDGQRILYRIIIEKIPFFVLSAISSIITFIAQLGSGAVADANILPLQNRFANALISYVTYIDKLFWPKNLAVFYPLDTGSSPFLQAAISILLLLVISVFVIRFGRKQRYLPVGWFWFIGTLIPVIGLIQSGPQALADRYTYIPYIGLFIMIAWGLPDLLSKLALSAANGWRHRKIALGVSMAIVLAALGISAYRQTSYWKNSITLFSHALDVTKNNYIAHYSIADELRKQDKIAPAIEHYNRSLKISPDYASSVLGLGCAFGEQGNTEKAIEYFQKTLQLKTAPDVAAYAHNNLGVALQQQGKFTEAFAHFTQAIQLYPDFADAHNNLAGALFQQGRVDEAVDQFRTAVQLRPDWIAPMKDLAWYIATHPELKNRDVNEAVRMAVRACEITNYRNPVVLGTLAAAYAAAGRFSQAVDTAKTAMAVADETNRPQIKNAIQYHLTFYSQGKPYIEPAPQPLSNPVNP